MEHWDFICLFAKQFKAHISRQNDRAEHNENIIIFCGIALVHFPLLQKYI